MSSLKRTTEGELEDHIDPVRALKSKLSKLSSGLSHQKHSSLLAPWSHADFKELSALISAVYQKSHKRAAPTKGSELLWVDKRYKRLHLMMIIAQKVKDFPIRPVAVIEQNLRTIDEDYNRAHLELNKEPNAVTRHNRLLEENSSYKSLFKLQKALGLPSTSIVDVKINEFESALSELCNEVKVAITNGIEKLPTAPIKRIINQVLYLELQRSELFWRLRYWDEAEALTLWIYELHEPTLLDLMRDVGLIVPETPQEYLKRRHLKGNLDRVRKHRSKSRIL
jgi:hypothetical protein